MAIVTSERRMKKRSVLVESLSDTYDVLVIGGGASGLGVAISAAARGYKTLLLEQSDFAKGTSSRSTKLVHGGVRYLAQGNFRLVREALIERSLLMRNAAHLVKNQEFIIPVYSLFDKFKYLIGLSLYDWISGSYSLGPTRFLSRKKILNQMPGLESKNLIGGISYHDGQFDDSRLAINLVQTLQELGGHAINYMQVTGFLKNKEDNLCGVQAVDTETSEQYKFSAKSTVNATGVFADELLQLDQPGQPKMICPSQGIHLVFDRKFYPSKFALMVPKTSDGRVLFALPWHQKVIVGTTDTPVELSSLEPRALNTEIDFILETLSQYLQNPPCRKDLLSVFAGLRPLAAPQHDEKKTKEISRSHQIIVSGSGLFTMLGGKWTTYRRMGEDMMNRIEVNLHWPKRIDRTRDLCIHGNKKYASKIEYKALGIYGSDSVILREKMEQGMAHQLSKRLEIYSVQVSWAVQQEMALTVEDFLSRRTRALFLDVKESLRIAPEVARIMAVELGKDEAWEAEQVESFALVAKNYLPSS